jgi:hypothetical protein
MSRTFGLLFAAVLFSSGSVHAQVLRTRTGVPRTYETPDPWSGYFRYNIATDYAETEQPRGYVQVLGGGAKYQFDSNWSVSADLTLKMETFNGQIEKGPEQSKAETLNPSTAVELDYEGKFADTHSYTYFVHGEPLWDEPSRLEGYKGIAGGGAELSLGFFNRHWVISQVLDISELLNSYDYSLETSSNPDMFYTYKLSNGFRLAPTLRFAYTFGVKLTRDLDASTKYNYNNAFTLSNTWKNWTVALVYENGGFTDDGTIHLWYIDQYRRVGQLMVNYTF